MAIIYVGRWCAPDYILAAREDPPFKDKDILEELLSIPECTSFSEDLVVNKMVAAVLLEVNDAIREDGFKRSPMTLSQLRMEGMTHFPYTYKLSWKGSGDIVGYIRIHPVEILL